MNTLRNWANKNNVMVSRHGHARCVSIDSPNQSDLFRLDDYRVSSVSTGTIWLIRCREFTPAEKNERANIRNLCVGAGSGNKGLMQLDSLYHLEGKSEFWQDCVAEYIFEIEAEMRDAGELVD